MPVYNAGEFLVPAIKSIINQSYENFEFIIVDDGSTDTSWQIIQQYAKKHKKIRIFRNYKHRGVSNTLKRAISKISINTSYIARMDADDIAFSMRLEKQVNYLETHRKTVAIGGQYILINGNGNIIGRRRLPTDFESIYKYIYKFNPVLQTTLMIATNLLPPDFEYYIDGMNTAEEIVLMFKLFRYGKVENLPEELAMYRIHSRNTSLLDIRKTFLLTILARLKAVFLYNYKPQLSDIFITLTQALIVLLLPEYLTLFIYNKMRNIPNPNYIIPSKVLVGVR